MLRTISISIILIFNLSAQAKNLEAGTIVDAVIGAIQLLKSQDSFKERAATMATLKEQLYELDSENSGFDQASHKARRYFQTTTPALNIKNKADCDKARHEIKMDNGSAENLKPEVELALNLIAAICN